MSAKTGNTKYRSEKRTEADTSDLKLPKHLASHFQVAALLWEVGFDCLADRAAQGRLKRRGEGL